MPLFSSVLPPKEDERLQHEPDFLATFDNQRNTLGRSLLPFGGVHRSAIAAVQMGAAIGWLQRNSSRSQKLLRSEQHARRRGRKAWPEDVVRIAGGEGRVSLPRLKETSCRSEEVEHLGQGLEPLFGGSGARPKKWMAAAFGAQWLSADGGAASAVQRMLGARRFPDAAPISVSSCKITVLLCSLIPHQSREH